MALHYAPRRKSPRTTARLVLVVVPTVWICVILYTGYSAQMAQQEEMRRQLRQLEVKHEQQRRDQVERMAALKHIDKGKKIKLYPNLNRRRFTKTKVSDDIKSDTSLKFVEEDEKSSYVDKNGIVLLPDPDDHIEVTGSSDDPLDIRPGLRFDPAKKGEHGVGVPSDPGHLSDSERLLYDRGWVNHQYNEFASMQISTQREIQDFRNNECKSTTYGDISQLPKASIIICFYNEAWSVLVRTVQSVLGQSPPELVQEVILVDDGSDMEDMHGRLEKYVARVAKLRLLRMRTRSGLVRARLAGVRKAKAPVLIFLDSHVECARGWLTPLLFTLSERPKMAVTPEIDVIDHKTFRVQPAIDNIGILDFRSFSFDWSPIFPRLQEKRKSEADPIESPTMAGGLFAIRKDFFIQLGTYDTDLELWGGENIELSLKLWMCGGGILIQPCSRVAHVFRDQSPYLKGSKENVLNKNSARVAQVWADEYRKQYFAPGKYNEEKYGSVLARQELRKSLKCHTFGWYVKFVYPELSVPGTGEFKGQIRSSQGLCLNRDQGRPFPSLGSCTSQRLLAWESSRIHQIRSHDLCLDLTLTGLTLISCDAISRSQRFKFNKTDKSIQSLHSHGCLTALSSSQVTEAPCTGALAQRWYWPDNPHHII